MNNTILLTRPNHDLITNYLYFWSGLVINEAIKRSIKTLDLQGKKANFKIFSSYLLKNKPAFVFLNGHGSKYAITGHNNEVLIEAGKNEQLLANKIIYARSCDAADRLGQNCVKSGTIAFIGYKRKFTVGYSPDSISIPLKDKVAKLFLEPSNLIPISLIKGNTVSQSYRKSQEMMSRNLRYMLSTNASQNQKDAAPYLWANKKYQVAIGDTNSKLY